MNLLSLDDVLEEWKKDSQYDEVLLDQSAHAVPSLHSKYLDYHSRFKRQLRMAQRKKRDFPAAERRSNEAYAKLDELLCQQEDGVEATQEILKAINQMSYNISASIRWKIFCNGSPESII